MVVKVLVCVIAFVILTRIARAGTMAAKLPDTPQNKRLKAFLKLIRTYESSLTPMAYYMHSGGGYTFDLSKHPKKLTYLTVNGKKIGTTAFGAYQITYDTYLDFGVKMGITGFSHADQDNIAINILRHHGVPSFLDKGLIEEAIQVAGIRWAAFPKKGKSHGQNPKKLDTLVKKYNSYVA